MPQNPGNPTLVPVSEAMNIPAGDNSGVATLVAGTVTVSFPRLTASSRIFCTRKSPVGTALTTNYGAPAAGRIVGTSFTLQADIAAGTINTADGSTLDWYIIP